MTSQPRSAIRERAAHICHKLQHFAFPVLVAMCAKPMRGFRDAHIWLQHVGGRAPGDGLKIVIMLCCIPCFKLSNLFFEITCALQYRHLVWLGRQSQHLAPRR